MWWSDDSQRLAFYEIDERHCETIGFLSHNVGSYNVDDGVCQQSVKAPRDSGANVC